MSEGLSPQNEQFIGDALAQGMFPSREALLDKAVQTLREVETDRQQLERALQFGSEDIDNGRVRPWDLEDAKRRLRERLSKKASN